MYVELIDTKIREQRKRKMIAVFRKRKEQKERLIDRITKDIEKKG
jgi:hypothetical protein